MGDVVRRFLAQLVPLGIAALVFLVLPAIAALAMCAMVVMLG